MVAFTYQIQDPLGIHARPAGLLVKEAEKLSSRVTISKDGKEGDGKKIFSLMGLAVKQGDVVTVTVRGDREKEEAKLLESFFRDNL